MAGERNSPQTLCLGKADFSKIRTPAPSRMAANAAITPAGPPPTTWTARIGAPPECHYTERMQRFFEAEILDVGGLSPEVLERAHRRLSQTQFFQGEDGMRDPSVTGVQTCALPICFPLLNGLANLPLIEINVGQMVVHRGVL